MFVFGIDVPLVEIMFVFFMISIILMVQSIVIVYMLIKKLKGKK